MPLADVAVALTTAFEARGCEVPIYVGEQYLHDHAGDSRIVLIHDRDDFGPPTISVATQLMVVGRNRSINPRALMSRHIGAVAHLWATAPLSSGDEVLDVDHQYMDALLNCFCASLHGVSNGVFSISGGEYVKEQAVHDRRGIAYRLSFSVAIPIIDSAWLGDTTYPVAEDVAANVNIDAENPTEETSETLLTFSTSES